MKITNKDIDRDVSFVLGEIKKSEVEIPSLWRCMWPGLLLPPLFFVWQFFILIGYDTRMDPSGTLAFSLFFYFGVILISTQLRGKYFSLPESVRKNSLIIRILKIKYIFYSLLWLFAVMAFGLLIRHYQFKPDFNMPFFMLFSFVIICFISIADLSRYDLSLLSAAIQRWREGKEIAPPHRKHIERLFNQQKRAQQ